MLERNWQVTWFHVLHVVLFAGSAMVLVSRLGFVGYGWAEIVTLLAYAMVHRFLARAVGSPSYSAPLIWYAAAASAIVFGGLGTPALYFGFAVPFIPLLFHRERLMITGYAQVLFSRVSA